MRINKKFVIIFLICTLIYALPELFIENAMVYISGGIIGGTIGDIFKNVSEGVNTFLIFLIWTVILFGLAFLFFRLKYLYLKYFVLLLIAFFLYIIDNSLAFISTDYYLINHGIRILSKSLILTAILYYGLYRKKVDESVTK